MITLEEFFDEYRKFMYVCACGAVNNSMEQISLREKHTDCIFRIPLFKDLPDNIKSKVLDELDCRVFALTPGDIIAKQNTPCLYLYVLLKGELRVDIIDAMGNEIMIEKIIAPRAYATPHLFTEDSTLPATFTVTEEGILLTATKESVFSLISAEPAILKNFLRVTGNCTKCTVTRLHALSQKGVRKRIISYLLDHTIETDNTVHIAHNQVQLADYLHVTRPALSKEINKMIKEGLIAVEKKIVRLLDLNRLKQAIR